MDPLSIDTLAGKVCSGFLVPAAVIPPEQWRERYKVINRAAGVVAGLALALRPDGDDNDRGILAEEIVRQAGIDMEILLDFGRLPPEIDEKTINTLCFGLRKRAAKCLLQLEGVTAPEVVS